MQQQWPIFLRLSPSPFLYHMMRYPNYVPLSMYVWILSNLYVTYLVGDMYYIHIYVRVNGGGLYYIHVHLHSKGFALTRHEISICLECEEFPS